MDLTKEQNQINLFIGLAESIFVSYYNYTVLDAEEDRTKILTKTCPEYFKFINELMTTDFFLQVTRIMDRCEFPIYKNGKKELRKNLTVSFIAHMPIWNEEQKEKLGYYQENLKVLADKRFLLEIE